MKTSKRQLTPEPSSDAVLSGTFILAVALVVVRWLIPTESAAEGDTLWIVELWFAAALLWAWSALRSGHVLIRVGPFDVALWTVILGHVLSTSVVFMKGGDRRAALDMAWEWIGLGTTYFVLRQVVQTSIDARRIASILIVLGVVLAGLGIWQHYVFYPRAAAEYREMTHDLNELRENLTANSARLAELELKMQSNGIPTDEVGRRQYENRLEFSTEPFGPFALANTFAGFLLVVLVIAGEWFRTSTRPRSKGFLVAWTAAFVLILYCLLLTKSRTAWVGLAVACAVWGISFALRRPVLNRRMLAVAAAGIVSLGVLLLVASFAGGFDWLVIAETPKSLEYRLQYWRGAIQVLRDHPIFGVGPGNFRHYYLQYKLPAASEEIADPHNIILDLWTSGGILAVLGFLACVLLPFWSAAAKRRDASDPMPSFPSTSTLTAMTIGFLLAVAAPVMSGTGIFDLAQLLLLACAWGAYELLCRRALKDSNATDLDGAALTGASVGLLVHLLGAGGIETPAIVQLLLLLVIHAFAQRSAGSLAIQSRMAAIGIGAAAITLFVCCLVTATLPILQRRALIAEGNAELMLHGDSKRALQDFIQAAAHDPLSPDPPERLADVYFARWRSDASGNASDFENSVKSYKIAMALDPQSPAPHRRLGEIYLAKFARQHEHGDAQAAVNAFAQAIQRYPNDSSLRAAYATALFDAQQFAEAKTEATRALEFDEINHQYEHTDRYLPNSTVATLKRLRDGLSP